MGALIDLTGKTFGRWTVLKRDTSKGMNGRPYWICQCECGTIRSVNGAKLRNGKTLSCGCLRNEKQSQERAIDLTGQKFGHLTVLKRYDNALAEGKKNAYWECQCDCGNPNIKIVRGNHLRGGNTKSCGVCTNWTEEFFGPEEHDFLEKLDYDFKTKKWNVKCKLCGSIVQMDHPNFKRNKSCGCLKSLGEYTIAKILSENNILFEREKTFENFTSSNNIHYRFDFYINNQYIIEYDGIQHFIEGNSHFNNPEQFKKTQENDTLKNQYCKKHNIPLIRIPHTHLKDLCLEDLLLETSNFILT